jgi:hypothetical protein
MPSSAASVKPSARTSSRKAVSSGACSSIFSEIVSQPRRLPISGPGPPQSVSSCFQIRLTTPSARAALTRAPIAGSSSVGIDVSIVGGRPVTIPSRVISMLAISAS